MLTKETLLEYGADYDAAMKLCMDNEAFYFKLIAKCVENERFASLGEHLRSNDLKGAFEDAHALKGAVGNLSLTPLYNAISDIVEPLRSGEQKDYGAQYEAIMTLREKLAALV